MKIDFVVSKKSLKRTDILGIACFEGPNHFPKGYALERSLADILKKLSAEKKFSGKCGEMYLALSPKSKAADAVLFIGLGKKDKFKLSCARVSAAKLLLQAKSFQHASASLDLDTLADSFSLAEVAGAAVEGARLSDYRFDKYKSKPASKKEVHLTLISQQEDEAKSVRAAIAEAEILSEAVYFTRNIANEPPNIMTPPALAQAAKEMASKNGLDCKVLGLQEIKKLGMGGVLGVSQGSSFPPQFIILENRVKSAEAPIVLVGKGVTFDTGGISIKPSNDMDKMKFDMCGAAAVIGAMKAVANLKIGIKVVGLVPVVENMPGSKAQRPGDIIKCLNGKTVEVLNTDAEGRLILADALSYAERYKPRVLVDIATLTGACAATFADLCSGVMSTDEDLVRRIKEIGDRTGEKMWELPLWDEYFDLIKATYADIQNISKKYAGTITAGMFLKEFADHTKTWAHLDVAGSAWNEGGAKPLSPIGATGIGVRLFVRLIQSYAKN